MADTPVPVQNSSGERLQTALSEANADVNRFLSDIYLSGNDTNFEYSSFKIYEDDLSDLFFIADVDIARFSSLVYSIKNHFGKNITFSSHSALNAAKVISETVENFRFISENGVELSKLEANSYHMELRFSFMISTNKLSNNLDGTFKYGLFLVKKKADGFDSSLIKETALNITQLV